VWKVKSMVENGMMTHQEDLLVENLSLRVTHFLGCNVKHESKIGHWEKRMMSKQTLHNQK
jgi:hypothetical protein